MGGNKIKMPEWAVYYKTGCYKDLAPYDQDWLYIRAASVAYQLYMRGKVGVNTLRKHYGSKQRNGVCTEHSRLSAGKCIRYCLIELKKPVLSERLPMNTMMDKTLQLAKPLPRKVPPIWTELLPKLPKKPERHNE